MLDPEAALQPGAPQLFPDGNLEGEPRTLTRGDVERGLAESDRVIERVYHCPTMWSGGMEPRVAIAQWGGEQADGVGVDAGTVPGADEPDGEVQSAR